MSVSDYSEGCPQLEQLNISWCDQVTKDGIQALVRCCPGLKGLFLKGCTQVLPQHTAQLLGTVSTAGKHTQDALPFSVCILVLEHNSGLFCFQGTNMPTSLMF